MPPRPYTWRWQLQPMVVTKEPAASDVIVPAYYRPAINGPARGALGRNTEIPRDGVWPAGMPHPNGPSFRARPLKIWRKRLAREAGRSGKSSGAGIGMPMDIPGGIASTDEQSPCARDTVCSYTTLPCNGLDERAPHALPGAGLTRLHTKTAHSLREAQRSCTADVGCAALIWSHQKREVRLYGCHACDGESLATDVIAEATAQGVCGPRTQGAGSVQVKAICSSGVERCGGAVLKDDVKARSQGLQVRPPAPGDSYYDPAAFRSVCVACSPENRRIRTTVRPVLGPGPNRSVDTIITAQRKGGALDNGSETVVFKRGMRISFPGQEKVVRKRMTLEAARAELSSDPKSAGFFFEGNSANTPGPVEVVAVPRGSRLTEVYDPQYSTFVKEPTFFSYVEAATDYRSYLHSRCQGIHQRRGRGDRVPGLPYFDPRGHPLPPSDAPDVGPPNYRPVTCPYFPASPSACSAPYKTSNPRFGVQGAVQSSARLARLKYEAATRGTNFTTAGALHAKNFGEFTDSPPSGYFLPQKFRVAECDRGLYRRSGKRVACFTPEPRPIDRIEH